MSNITTETKALKEKTERLEESQEHREIMLAEYQEIFEIAREIKPSFLAALPGMREAAELDTELFAAARHELTRRRLKALPEEVAGAVATDWRTVLSGVAQTVLGIGVFALGATLVSKLGESSEPQPGELTDTNPFSDTTAAAPARAPRRRDSTVVPFDRQA